MQLLLMFSEISIQRRQCKSRRQKLQNSFLAAHFYATNSLNSTHIFLLYTVIKWSNWTGTVQHTIPLFLKNHVLHHTKLQTAVYTLCTSMATSKTTRITKIIPRSTWSKCQITA